MTKYAFERAEKIDKELGRLQSQLYNLSNSIRHEEEQNKRGNFREKKRLFCRFALNDTRAQVKNSDVVYVFFPEAIRGVEIDLDLDFVMLLKTHLEEKVKKLTQDMEAL